MSAGRDGLVNIAETVRADLAGAGGPEHPRRVGLDLIAPRHDFGDHLHQAPSRLFMTLQFGLAGVGLGVQVPQVDDIAVELDGVPAYRRRTVWLR